MRKITRRYNIFFGMNLITFTLILCWITAVPAFSTTSTNPESGLSLALHSGYHQAYRFGTLFPVEGSADIPTEEVLLEHRNPVWGLSLTHPLNARVDIQAEVIGGNAAIVHDVGIGLAGVPLGKTKVSDASVLTWAGNVLFHVIPGRKISPYVTGGLGAVTLRTAAFGTRTRIMISMGAGMQFPLSRRLYLDLNAKDTMHFINFSRDFDVFYIAIYTPEFGNTHHSLGLHLGLGYSF